MIKNIVALDIEIFCSAIGENNFDQVQRMSYIEKLKVLCWLGIDSKVVMLMKKESKVIVCFSEINVSGATMKVVFNMFNTFMAEVNNFALLPI